MKKFYAAMALAVAVGVPANAENVKLADAQALQAVPRVEAAAPNVDLVNPTRDNGPKKVLDFKTIEDLYGIYAFYAIVPLQGQPQGYQRFTLDIRPSEKEGYVQLIGLCSAYPAEAKVDLQKQTLTIEKQLAFHNSYYDADVYLTPGRWNASGDGWDETDDFVLEYLPDGREVDVTDDEGKPTGEKETIFKGWLVYRNFEDVLYLPLKTAQGEGYFGAMYGIQCIDLDKVNIPVNELFPAPFTYNAADWEDHGTCLFTDGFLAPAMNASFDPYTLKVQQNKNNPNLVLLMDPYGQDSPFAQVNTAKEPGYIMLDVTNRDLVKVVPMVYSGFADGDDLFRYYFSNFAGVSYYVDAASDADIMDNIDILGYEYPVLIDEDRVCKLTDTQSTTSNELFTYSSWTDADGEFIESETVIEFSNPVGGVQGIINDTDLNAPALYYNLQGARVAAPAKGDIVIVKKGGKATKVIF